MDTLTEWAALASLNFNEISAQIKAKESRMKEIAELQRHIGNYSRTRDFYVKYREAGYSKKFLMTHEAGIRIHQAAKKAFNDLNIKKLPTIKSLQTDYAALLAEKNKLYQNYKKVRDEMRTANLVKANARYLLRYEPAHTDKETEKTER